MAPLSVSTYTTPSNGVSLLRLLLSGLSTSQVLSDVGGINSLAAESLDGFPALSNGRWDVGILHLLVDVSRSLREGTLDKLALVESCSQEDGVNAQ